MAAARGMIALILDNIETSCTPLHTEGGFIICAIMPRKPVDDGPGDGSVTVRRPRGNGGSKRTTIDRGPHRQRDRGIRQRRPEETGGGGKVEAARPVKRTGGSGLRALALICARRSNLRSGSGRSSRAPSPRRIGPFPRARRLASCCNSVPPVPAGLCPSRGLRLRAAACLRRSSAVPPSRVPWFRAAPLLEWWFAIGGGCRRGGRPGARLRFVARRGRAIAAPLGGPRLFGGSPACRAPAASGGPFPGRRRVNPPCFRLRLLGLASGVAGNRAPGAPPRCRGRARLAPDCRPRPRGGVCRVIFLSLPAACLYASGGADGSEGKAPSLTGNG